MAKVEKTNVEIEALIAKRDFIICQNDTYIEIKEGDDVSRLPAEYMENLKTEQVI